MCTDDSTADDKDYICDKDYLGDKDFMVHLRLARISTGTKRRTKYSHLYNDVLWLTLTTRGQIPNTKLTEILFVDKIHTYLLELKSDNVGHGRKISSKK